MQVLRRADAQVFVNWIEVIRRLSFHLRLRACPLELATFLDEFPDGFLPRTDGAHR